MTRKLVSRKGTLLGTVTFPNYWNVDIEQRGGVVFRVCEPFRLSDYLAPDADVHAEVKVGRLLRTWCGDIRDAVMLDGISLEDFERIPGCHFAPSAAYLRSLIE